MNLLERYEKACVNIGIKDLSQAVKEEPKTTIPGSFINATIVNGELRIPLDDDRMLLPSSGEIIQPSSRGYIPSNVFHPGVYIQQDLQVLHPGYSQGDLTGPPTYLH